ncbi:hypothetical protein AGMMS50256_15230 [Betaproteobacteria bacterium]|nr:hypothetical protein AGMMS50256_15230 [Betaproteobacteria bacterium]
MSLTEMTGASGTPSRRRLVLILASLAAFGPLATDMYLPALPEMTESLGADDAAGQLTISVFLAGVAVSQLSDKRHQLSPVLIVPTVFSIICKPDVSVT